MRLLITIPHFIRRADPGESAVKKRLKHASQTASAETRIQALRKTVLSIHQSFGSSQAMIHIADRRTIPANEMTCTEVHVVVVTTRNDHVMNQADFSPDDCQHFKRDCEPVNLGFDCHKVLRDRWGNYDYYGYLEDDLAILDPWFFEKLRWFNSYLGNESVLLPNRYERSERLAFKKCYLDGDLAARVTKPFQDIRQRPELKSFVLGKAIRFIRPLNPHSGCFFLNADQMQTWMRRADFGRPSSTFIGPLESAATLGIMKTFRIYEPALENANFLEIEHAGDRFLRLIRRNPRAKHH